MAEGEEIGRVSAYFARAGVAAIKLTGNLKIGDKISIQGTTTNFKTEVKSMQIEKESIKKANVGDHVGVKVPERVRPNDIVYVTG